MTGDEWQKQLGVRLLRWHLLHLIGTGVPISEDEPEMDEKQQGAFYFIIENSKTQI